MIRTKGQVLEEIRNSPEMWKTFCGWEEKYQQEYLDICTGVKGVKLLYDTYFKVIMNPDTRPERLNDFLSEILGRKIRILKVLPNESARIAAESSLLIMDIVVQFEDGSIANVEVQKMGYLFPGQRSACYSSDLLLRQYKRVRAELGNSFTYKRIQKVYTIVLFEKSSADFRRFSKEIYIHHCEQKSDTPEMIIKLLNQNSDFQKIYEEIYTLCLNMEGMMEMFSKELEILDRNTVKLMIDEMEEELAQVKASVAKQVEEQVAEKVAEQVAQAKENIARELEEEKQKIEEEKQRTEEEKQRADKAEEENMRLRKKLMELQKL